MKTVNFKKILFFAFLTFAFAGGLFFSGGNTIATEGECPIYTIGLSINTYEPDDDLEEVKELQKILSEDEDVWKKDNENYQVNGVFNGATVIALYKFQVKYNLPAKTNDDLAGVMDEATINKLCEFWEDINEDVGEEDPVSGTLSVSASSIDLGETATITVKAQDDQGVDKVFAYYQGDWHQQSCGEQNSCQKTFSVKEAKAGRYTYYGYVRGKKLNGTTEGYWTIPQSLKVDVNSEENTTTTTTAKTATTAGTIITFTPETCTAYGQSRGMGDSYSCLPAENCASTRVAGPCPIDGRMYFCCLNHTVQCSDFADQGYACINPFAGKRENCQPGTILPGPVCKSGHQVVCCKPKPASKCVADVTFVGYCGENPKYRRDWKCVLSKTGEPDDGCDVGGLILPCFVKYGTYSGVCPPESCVAASDCKGLINNHYGCLGANQVCCNYDIESIPITKNNICNHICVQPYPNSQCPESICGCGNYERKVGKLCPAGTGFICCGPKDENKNSAVCGNGEVESGETCDDGNTTSGDGCSSSCQEEKINSVCGNGKVEPGETCDGSDSLIGRTCPDLGYNDGEVRCVNCLYENNCYNTYYHYLGCGENGVCVGKKTLEYPANDADGCTKMGGLCGEDPCKGKECGDDGSGGSCGICPTSRPTCINGKCYKKVPLE